MIAARCGHLMRDQLLSPAANQVGKRFMLYQLWVALQKSSTRTKARFMSTCGCGQGFRGLPPGSTWQLVHSLRGEKRPTITLVSLMDSSPVPVTSPPAEYRDC